MASGRNGGEPSGNVSRAKTHTMYAKTFGDSYIDLGLIADGDSRGMIDNRKLEFSYGMEVSITDPQNERRTSVNSCVGILSFQTVRKPIAKCPAVEGIGGARREISLTAQCATMANKNWRNAVQVRERSCRRCVEVDSERSLEGDSRRNM